MTFRSMFPAILFFAASSIWATPQVSLIAGTSPERGKTSSGSDAPGQKTGGPGKTEGKGNRPNPPRAAQTLTGIVEWEYKTLAWDCDVPNCDHFALYADATHINYEVDNARKALPFEGKRAKVTGVVDAKNHVIHLLSIEAEK